MSYKLEDLLGLYPPTNVEAGFQSTLYNKEEFRQLEGKTSESLGERYGTFFSHQLMFQRFLRYYTEILYIAEAGTGKSCAFAAIAEFCRKNDMGITKAYFVTGGAQKEDFKRQLICTCTKDQFYVKPSSDDSEYKRNASTAISKWYKVMTYGEFVSEVAKSKASVRSVNQMIREKYSGSIFFLDEIQKIKMTNFSPDRKKYPDRFYVYAQVWRILHLAQRSIKIIASAKPILNSLDELGYHLNLILPLNNQIRYPLMDLIAKKFRLEDSLRSRQLTIDPDTPIEAYRRFLQGRVFYVRAFDTGVTPIYPERYEDDSELFLEMVIMGQKQRDAYIAAVDSESRGDGKKKGGVYIPSRKASNWIYPNGNVEDPNHEYISWSDKGKLTVKTKLSQFLDKTSNLARISTKCAFIANKLEELPDKKFYVFTGFKEAGGAYQIGAMLMTKGYEQYNSEKSPFRTEGGSRDYCSSSKTASQISLDIKPRFAIITSNNKSAHSNILEVFNSKDNLFGEYIRIIIITPIGQVGINLTDVGCVIQYDAMLSPSEEYQARNRAFRTTSHINTIQYRQAQGITEALEVYVYPLASTYQLDNGDLNVSIDEKIYKFAEVKNREISKIMRVLKIYAADCHLQKRRNVRQSDRDDSLECDYDVCDYDCIDPLQIEADYSTYNQYYLSEIVEKFTIEVLRPYFRLNSRGTPDHIYGTFFREKDVESRNQKILSIYFALENAINKKTPFLNRFGFRCYLYFDNQVYYLSQEYPFLTGVSHIGDASRCYYSESLITVREEDLPSVALEIGSLQGEEWWRKIYLLDPESSEFADEMQNLVEDIIPHTIILEEALDVAIQNRIENRQFDPIVEAVVEFNKPYFLLFRDATVGTEIRKQKIDSLSKVKVGDKIEVYHKAYIPVPKKAKHGAMSKLRNVTEPKIKVYYSSTRKWTFAEDEIAETMKEQFRRQLEKSSRSFKKQPISGVYDNGKFWIIDRRSGSKTVGREAETLDKNILISIMYDIGIPMRMKFDKKKSEKSRRENAIAMYNRHHARATINLDSRIKVTEKTTVRVGDIPIDKLEYIVAYDAYDFGAPKTRTGTKDVNKKLMMAYFIFLKMNEKNLINFPNLDEKGRKTAVKKFIQSVKNSTRHKLPSLPEDDPSGSSDSS